MRARSPRLGRDFYDAAILWPRDAGQGNHVAEPEQRFHGVEAIRVVMIAGDGHHGPFPCEPEQDFVDDLFGLGPRRRRVEQVPGHEDGVDLPVVRDVRDLRQHGAVLVGPAAPPQGLAHVPVAGVQEAHGQPKPSNGSSGSSAEDTVAASLARVAQEGNGNWVTSGIGSSGCERIIVPGFRIVARCRWTVGRKPYSSRPASAASRRPTTRKDELATMRRSTSLAVCWAPIRMMPSDRPRSDMSTRISLMGLEPSRGAYLFNSSRTTNSNGRWTPARSFSSKGAAQGHADDEALGAIVQIVDVHDSHLGLAVNAVTLGVGNVSSDEVLEVPDRPEEAPDEGVDGALTDGAPSPFADRGLVLQAIRDQLGQRVELGDGLAVDRNPAVGQRRGRIAELGHHVVDDDGVLLPVVLRVGEHERQEAVGAEFCQRPE